MRHARRIGYLILAVASLPGTEVPLHLIQGRPVVDGVFLNGHGPYRFLLDTGAQSSQFDILLTREIGLCPSFRVEMATIMGVREVAGTDGIRIRLGAAEAASTEVLFTPMAAIQQLSKDIRGVLGQSFLARFDYLLDIRGSRIVFGTQEREGLRVELDMSAARPAVYTSFGRLVVDSGTDRLILFGPRRAANTRSRRLTIEGRSIRHSGAVTMARQEGRAEDGLLPAAAFDSIYFCHSGGYMVFE